MSDSIDWSIINYWWQFAEEKQTTARAKRLVDKFSNPATEVYLLFLQCVISKFDKANLVLQREQASIHLVHDTLALLYIDLVASFIDPDDSDEEIDDDPPNIVYLPG